MSQFARVDSFGALQDFKVALCTFAEVVRLALDEAEGEIRRTIIWLKQDQHSYWKGQVRKRTELVARAKAALQQKKMQGTALGGRASDVEERKALAAAVRQLEEAEQKLANVRRWVRQLEIETFNFKATVQGLEHAVEAGVPRSTGRLDGMIRALDSYVALVPPTMAEPGGLSQTDEAKPVADRVAAEAPEAEVPDDLSVTTCASLRARTPPAGVRDGIPVGEPDSGWLRRPELRETDRAALAALATKEVSVASRDKIVMAVGSCEHPHLYFERLESVGSGGCAGYVGFADSRIAESHQGVEAADLLERRPDWTEILQLPPGWLVVLDGHAVEVVFDADGTAVWQRDGSVAEE